MERPRLYQGCLLTGLMVGAILSILYLAGAFSSVQHRLQDPLYGGQRAPPSILILAIDDASLQQIGRWPWNRSVFARLLPKIAGAKAVGFDVVFAEPSPDDAGLAQAIHFHGRVILPVEYGSFATNQGRVQPEHALLPLPEFQDAARGLGVINLITDEDGITRAANTAMEGQHSLFAQALASIEQPQTVPSDPRLLINFLGPPRTIRTLSISDVLFDRMAIPDLHNTIVLIGATAPDLHDNYLVPTSQGLLMSGVEVHAHLLQMILTSSYLASEPAWAVAAGILIISLLVSLSIARFHAWTAAGITISLTLLYILAAVMLFEQRLILDLFFAPLSAVASYVSNLVNSFLREKRHKKQIFEAFNKYVSPKVIQELLKHPDKLKLGGEKRDITIFFSDIRGFTTISEALSPEGLVELLNEYLTAMTDLVISHDGVIDKYMGDAIMAFWGAPLDQPNHATLACRASLNMIATLHRLQQEWTARGVPPLRIGIGLNTGPAVVGNMGSNQRFDYTCMGDTVNLGSRLEGLNKEYGTTIIASETTREAVRSGENKALFAFRELDRVRVKGKKEPVTIYELVGLAHQISPAAKKALALFAAGLRQYRTQHFKQAIATFQQASSQYHDAPSTAYIERCTYFLEHPPGKAWDGVWVMKTK